MSYALPLPPRPNIEQYKKLAKDFQRACKSHDPRAVRDLAARWAETIARLQGLEIAPQLRRRIEGRLSVSWSRRLRSWYGKTMSKVGREAQRRAFLKLTEPAAGRC